MLLCLFLRLSVSYLVRQYWQRGFFKFCMVFKPITWIRSFGKNWTNIFFILFYIKVINLERQYSTGQCNWNRHQKNHLQHPSVVDCSGMMNKIKLVNDCLTSLYIICTQRKKIWDYKHVWWCSTSVFWCFCYLLLFKQTSVKPASRSIGQTLE